MTMNAPRAISCLVDVRRLMVDGYYREREPLAAAVAGPVGMEAVRHTVWSARARR